MSDARSIPWMPIRTDEWMQSERIILMTVEQEWAFFRLIMRCWRDGSVPASPESCAQLLGKGVTVASVSVALREFVACENDANRMIHARTIEERGDAIHKVEKNRANGKKGGRPKKTKRITQSEPTANPTVNHSLTQSEPNSKPIEKEKEKENRELDLKEKINKKEKVADAPLVFAFESAEFKKWWSAYQDARKKKKYPSTPAIAESHMKILSAMGEANAIEALIASTEGGWRKPWLPDKLKQTATAPSGESEHARLIREWEERNKRDAELDAK